MNLKVIAGRIISMDAMAEFVLKNSPKIDESNYSLEQMKADLLRHEGIHGTDKCRFCEFERLGAEYVRQQKPFADSK